ncbi:MAG: glucosaminidase domain-containing protein [Solirubrobacteraceae bacterium]
MKLKLLLIFTIFFHSLIFSQDEKEINYIIKHAGLAIQEMNLYKIPASIKLAQGIIETGGGQSRLAEKANNHFGIKCKAEWKGESIYHDDDALGECFRKYQSVEASYRDHSKFLAERPYYKSLFTLPILDYKAWSVGLKTSGYATNPNYSQMLITKIKTYKLYEFDLPLNTSLEDKHAELYPQYSNSLVAKIEDKNQPIVMPQDDFQKTTPTNNKLDPNKRILNHENGLKYVILQKRETITKVGTTFQIPEKDLLYYNDLIFPSLAKEEQFIFLEKKKNTGFNSTYTVQKGDTMYGISQKLGMDIYYLYHFNSMKHTQEPVENQVLALKFIKN